jgi:hypothetical protein
MGSCRWVSQKYAFQIESHKRRELLAYRSQPEHVTRSATSRVSRSDFASLLSNVSYFPLTVFTRSLGPGTRSVP